MFRTRLGCLLALTAVALAEPAVQVPADWALNGRAEGYTAQVDHSVFSSGAASALLASKGSSATGFGGLIQVTAAANYRGKRIRYSGDLKTQGAKDWAGLWFRIDSADGKVLAFDNMQAKERQVRGDTNWQRYGIVIDVPDDAANIVYGVTLSGAGKVWADALRIEVVDLSVPVTSQMVAPATNSPLAITPPSVPRNLDFEQ